MDRCISVSARNPSETESVTTPFSNPYPVMLTSSGSAQTRSALIAGEERRVTAVSSSIPSAPISGYGSGRISSPVFSGAVFSL